MKKIQTTHYLGIFILHQLTTVCQEYSQLLTFTNNGVSVYIFYRRDYPFYIERIGVQLIEDKLDLFECGIPTESDVEAKAFALTFAEELVNYRQTFLDFRNALMQNSNSL